MTAQGMDGPPVPDSESLAFEAIVLASVTAEATTLVTDVIGQFLAAWEAATRGGTLAPVVARALGRAVAIRLRRLHWSPMAPRLRVAAQEAREFGLSRAVERLPRGERADLVLDPAWRTRGVSWDVIPAADTALRAKLAESAKLATTLNLVRRGNLLTVAGRARSGIAQVRGHARWVTHEGINAGTAEVARATGKRLLWVPERDACLHCLALAGWATEPGEMFPTRSYDPAAKPSVAVPWPPLHPNCRCEVRTYDGPAGRPSRERSRVDPASRLAAEARRSVVYQWTDHASEPAARRAASALLKAGAGLPHTVEERARRRLRKQGKRSP